MFALAAIALAVLFAGAMLFHDTEKAVPRQQEVISRKIFDKLKAEDPAKWANLHFLSGVDQLPNNSDCTTDHCHPNVYGFMYMAPVYAKAVRKILGL